MKFTDDFNKQFLNLDNLSNQYVIIYTHDNDNLENYAPHVKPRKFTNWIQRHQPLFKLIKNIPNRYPYIIGKEETTSFSDFNIYQRKN